MLLVFEIVFPLLWLWLLFRLWRTDRWLSSLLLAFYFVCLALETVAIRFGEYYYGPLAVGFCLPQGLWRAGAADCLQPDHCLPLAVPCLEGLLFFAGWLWAERREPAPALRPLAAAVLAVGADLIFDPVAARGELCGGGVGWDGVGLWTWLLEPADPGQYFGIPVDNPLAWLASCLGFGYAAKLLPRWRGKDTASLGGWDLASLAAQVSLLGLVFAGLFFVALDLWVTPPGTGEGYRLGMLFGLLGTLFGWLLYRAWRHRPAAGAPLDRAATTVIAATLLYALAALLLGYDRPELYPLWGLVAAALAAYWAAGAFSRSPPR